MLIVVVPNKKVMMPVLQREENMFVENFVGVSQIHNLHITELMVDEIRDKFETYCTVFYRCMKS